MSDGHEVILALAIFSRELCLAGGRVINYVWQGLQLLKHTLRLAGGSSRLNMKFYV